MTFRVGQKVVCVNDNGRSLRPSWEILPVRGETYTIRCIEGRAVRLAEIINDPFPYSEGLGELKFLASRFRPIVERKTDISIFTKMLTPQGIDA
jgi:hypothetical protein